MIATGESTGDVGTMLESVASAIDTESDAIMSGLAAKMEVALLVVLGVVVGGLIIIMYLPILNMASQGFSQGG
jgi:type IV pilus assembly protein PilC